MATTYDFLVDTYATEIDKTLSVWSQCDDRWLVVRPRAGDRRGRNLLEHMVHQCASENGWFENMFGIKTVTAPQPSEDTRLGYLRTYAACAAERIAALRSKDEAWWTTVVPFFAVQRPRTWILVRRIAHTAHHRGQQTMLLRSLGMPLYSTYGPTADTGGLAKDKPAVVYPYADVATLLHEEASEREKARLPGMPARPVTERAGH